MSEIKVNSIKGVNSTDAAITINNTDGTCTANLTNRTNKNLWINGACLVNQRGSSSTSEGYQTIDRFYVGSGGTNEAPTQAQVDVASGTTPYTLGFRKALKITNGNQTSGAGTADFMYLKYCFEAQDIANSGWNYLSSSSFITLSFYVKSSVAQSFKAYFHTRQGTEYQYPFETGSLSADTWTKVTKTISGNSNLTFNSDNGLGLELYIWSFIGTDYTASSVTEDAWSTYTNAARTKDATSTWYTTNDATLEFTGFQFEVSDHATDFEHRSFAQELTLCQRYFQRVPKNPSDGYGGICNGRVNDSTTAELLLNFSEMRATPTLTSSGNRRILHGGSAKGVTGVNLIHGSKTTIFFSATVASGLTAGDSAQLTMNNDTTAHIALSAEL